MNKLLRLLFICVCCCATSTSVRAQNGGALISVGKNVATGGVSAASHLPAAGKAAVVSTEKVTQAINTAQHGAQATAQGISSQRTMPAGETGVKNSPLFAFSQVTHVPPPPPITKAELPKPSPLGNELTGWAEHLTTPDTTREVTTMLRLLERQMNFIRVSRAQFTEEQLARIDEAETYFLNLTPERANDIHTISSVLFRRHAMVLFSPTATEYGYFFTGSNLLEHNRHDYQFENHLVRGYIPIVRGNPNGGLVGEWNMENMVPFVTKTDRPIFVLLFMHGGIDAKSEFFAQASPSQQISTEDIVTEIQKLRQATETPELNLFIDSCHSGAFLDEFDSLPLSQRQGINVFVPTGAGQCIYSFYTFPYFCSHQEGRNIADELVEKMIERIIKGQILAQANIAGQSFNPLELAIQKANALGDYHLANHLGNLFNLQKAKLQNAEDPSFSSDENINYFIARTAYEEAVKRYGNFFQNKEGLKKSLQQLKDNYALIHHISPEDWILEEKNWDGRFGFKPLY